jgi:3-dehydroquinate synthase
MNQRIIISTHLESEIANALTECEHDKIFILVDEVTKEKCLPVIQGFFTLKNAQVIRIGATDTHKDLETIAHVWKSLGDGGGSRHSCLINLGGGMVTDLGGYLRI